MEIERRESKVVHGGLASATGEICRDLCRYKAVATLERDIVYDITSVIPVKWPVSSGVP